MLISDSRKVLFVHVPKTGGVSVEETVKEACPDARKARVPIGRHATLGKIIKHEPQVIDYWTFGFVRNPWARMVSWYSMISAWDRRHGPRSGKPQDVKHNSMRDGNDMWRAAAAYSGFDEFVMRGTEELPRVGTPQILPSRTAMGGIASSDRSIPSTSGATMSRDFGPCTAITAHCSEIEVSQTSRCGNSVWR